MIKSISFGRFRVWQIFFLLFFCVSSLITAQNTTNSPIKKYNIAMEVAIEHSDSAMVLLENCIISFKKENNQEFLFDSYFNLSYLHVVNLNYSEALDYGWDAYMLAQQMQDTLLVAKASLSLGKLFYYFGKLEESEQLLKSANSTYKHLSSKNLLDTVQLISSYYDIAMMYNWFDISDIALRYIDTCLQLSNSINTNAVSKGYIEAEQARIYIKLNKLDTAETLLLKVKEIYENITPDTKNVDEYISYLGIIYYYMGELYAKKEQNDLAIEYFTKSNSTSDKYRKHKNAQSKAHEKIAKLYFKKGNHTKAYIHLKKSKEISDFYFGARSERNSKIIELKRKYKEELANKNKELLLKEKKLAEQQKWLFWLRTLFILLLALVSIAVILTRTKIQRIKYRKEKAELENNKKQSDLLIEQQNKELVAFTLKLIEKEKIIKQIATRKKSTSKNSKAMLKSIEKSSEGLWNEFNSRFISVNKGFYERLSEKYPNLSSTEKKYCALIKLNFSGKETAHLLGISLPSVHVARHRLRKKLGLEHNVNLGSYISLI